MEDRLLLSYTFTLIADNQSAGTPFRDTFLARPSLSSNGQVAFVAERTTAGRGVYRGDGGNLTTIATAGAIVRTFPGATANNASGAVVFFADLLGGVRAIYGGDGQVLTPVFYSTNPTLPALNDDGLVAFRTPLLGGGQAIFTCPWLCTEDALTLVVRTDANFTSFSGITINNRGDIGFLATLQGGGSGIYVKDANGLRTVVTTDDSLIGLTGQSLNEQGTVAFRGQFASGYQAIFTVTAWGTWGFVADTGGTFSMLDTLLDINSQGTVVFAAALADGRLGVFAGQDGAIDPVIQEGQPFFGSTLTSDVGGVFREAFNDHGQIALGVRLANGRTLVLRADPSGGGAPGEMPGGGSVPLPEVYGSLLLSAALPTGQPERTTFAQAVPVSLAPGLTREVLSRPVEETDGWLAFSGRRSAVELEDRVVDQLFVEAVTDQFGAVLVP